jgi:tryptophan synthase beta chain
MQTKVVLDESEMPTHWYNIVADLPSPPPPHLHPATQQPLVPDDFGDTAHLTPLLKMYSLGADFVPDPVHAGGLRYHGMSPLVSHCYAQGLITAIAVKQREAFEAGVLFARAEGIVPASESNHAIAGALRQARQATADGESPVIVIGVSGSGQLDLPAYAEYLTGTMPDS